MSTFGRADTTGRHIFVLQVQRWKRAMLQAYFPDARFEYLPPYISDREFLRDWQDAIKGRPQAALLVWSRNISDAILAFAHANEIPVFFLEDGFIRSLVGAASKSLPFSLTLDSRTPFFDASRASDLEVILNTYDFDRDEALMERARLGMEQLLRSRLSKYNPSGVQAAAFKAFETPRRRVLVIGQVEDDASIRLGCDRKITNNDLVRLAASENPGAEILYKPHPDVLSGVRNQISDPEHVRHLATVITDAIPLPDLLDRSHHVYAITSLGGFEALLRGLPVTLMGCPFYAGWGLTDDRQPNARRGRRLSIEELFAAAYLLYPYYFNPIDGTRITFEECLALAAQWRETGMPPSEIASVPVPAKPGFEYVGAYGLLGWRHLMTAPIARIIAMTGARMAADTYRANPVLFFRERSDPWLRRLGRVLYPIDDNRQKGRNK